MQSKAELNARAERPSYFGLFLERGFLSYFVTHITGVVLDHLVLGRALYGELARNVDLGVRVSLAVAVFVLPFMLFSATAGVFADRYNRAAMIRWGRLFELAVLVALFYAAWYESLAALSAAMLLLGTRSALLGPAKYAALHGMVKPGQVLVATSLVTTGTLIAILVGQLAALWITKHADDTTLLTIASALVAVGFLASIFIPTSRPDGPIPAVSWLPWTASRAAYLRLRHDRHLWLASLGLSWFWFVGAIYLIQFPLYVQNVLLGSPLLAVMVIGSMAFGMLLGGLAGERLAVDRIELGLVPGGAAGLAICTALLWTHDFSLVDHHVSNLQEFLTIEGGAYLMVLLFLVGVFSSFYMVPLRSLVMDQAQPAARARMMAANNVLNALFMTLAAFFCAWLMDAGVSPGWIFLATALASVVVTWSIFKLMPLFVLKFLVLVLVRVFYRVNKAGLQHIPQKGGVLMVANHVSFVDWLILGAVIPRPPRFVMDYAIYNVKSVNFIFRAGRTIPIAPAHKDPQMLERAYDEIARSLERGDVVFIFPEGKLTSDGDIAEFKQGMERILARTPVPVVPVALRGLWGSFFSRKNGSAMKGIPKRFWSRIEVVVGQAISPDQASSELLQTKVSELRGDWR